ncbi:hypothetical protein Cgig2_029300 [Carnegiea gigantea]|uniref:Potassium channel n=1 Tax=Carnegiea gigantea TaxID=171969 RepID=A0A9Q1QP36_9CARY|nr:hypothetical protein Cgig2_029300 [Carnegiea gigantea]
MSLPCSKSFFKRFCVDELKVEGSSCSYGGIFDTSDILPSLGARINQATKLRKHIVSPFDPRYRAWEMLLVVLVVYSAWICPFEFAFLTYKRDALFIVDHIVNGFFAVDIVLTFFVAYVDRRTYLLIDDHKKIAIRYLSTWFIFDVCSTAPLQSLSLFFTDHNGGLGFKALNMLRLWRLRRVSSLFARLEKDIRFNYFWTRCTKLISVTLFAVHCAGCFYYLIADKYPDPSKTWIGAVNPNFKSQSNVTVHLVIQRDTVRACTEFAARNQLPPQIQEQMLSHVCLKFKTEGLKQQETLNGLPKAIRSSIAQYLFLPIVQRVQLFQGVSHNTLFQLVSEIDAEYFPPREDVILQNEAPSDVYILVSGAAEMVLRVNGHDQRVQKVLAGDTFGDIGVLCDSPQPFTVRTTELSQLLRLSKTSLLNITQANKADGHIIMSNLYAKLKALESQGLVEPQTCEALFLYGEWADRLSSTKSAACPVGTHLMAHEDHAEFRAAVQHEDLNTLKIVFDEGVDAPQWDRQGPLLRQQNGDIHDRLRFADNRYLHETENTEFKSQHTANTNNSEGNKSSCCHCQAVPKNPGFNSKIRVTIHIMQLGTSSAEKHIGKLINLPDTLEDLLLIAGKFISSLQYQPQICYLVGIINLAPNRVGLGSVKSDAASGLVLDHLYYVIVYISVLPGLTKSCGVAGQKFGGCHFTEIVNSENAEIEDISVIRDGDHLFFL